MEKEYTSVDEVHGTILETAAQIANRTLRELEDVSARYGPGQRFNIDRRRKLFGAGDVFRADGARSEKGGLCLSLDELVVKGRSPEEIEALHEIGREAIKESITRWHPDLFAGLIVGLARKGENYFDRYQSEFHQTRLI